MFCFRHFLHNFSIFLIIFKLLVPFIMFSTFFHTFSNSSNVPRTFLFKYTFLSNFCTLSCIQHFQTWVTRTPMAGYVRYFKMYVKYFSLFKIQCNIAIFRVSLIYIQLHKKIILGLPVLFKLKLKINRMMSKSAAYVEWPKKPPLMKKVELLFHC